MIDWIEKNHEEERTTVIQNELNKGFADSKRRDTIIPLCWTILFGKSQKDYLLDVQLELEVQFALTKFYS